MNRPRGAVAKLAGPTARLLTLALLFTPIAVRAQTRTETREPAMESQESAADAMARVRFLLGRWEGEGQMRMGPGEPRESHVTEKVYEKLNGRLLVLEGHGTVPGAEGDPPVTVHEAFGLLAWDAAAGEYLLRAFRGDGQFVDADVEVGDGTLIWSFASPRGLVRYTLQVDDQGRWREIGEFSRNGSEWSQFFEMTLRRIGDS
jgi:hypothetical protein